MAGHEQPYKKSAQAGGGHMRHGMQIESSDPVPKCACSRSRLFNLPVKTRNARARVKAVEVSTDSSFISVVCCM
jgi:hypothetical protein